MADYDLPDDLLQLKRDFLRLDAETHEQASALPSSVDVVALEAEPDDAGRARLAELRAERLEVVERINRHAWWETVDNRYKASMALLEAARA